MFSTLKVVILVFLCVSQNVGYCSNSYGNDEKRQKSTWENIKETVSEASENDLLKFGLKTAAIAGVTLVGAPVVISAAGFGAAGIAAGSAAATVQGLWFGGTITGMSGAVFAGLQSVGAAGLGVIAKTTIVTASGAAVKLYDTLKEDTSKHEIESKAQGCTEANAESCTKTTICTETRIRSCTETRTEYYAETASKSCNES